MEVLIDENHPVRIVNQIIYNLRIITLIERYKEGGTSSFHPRLLLKVIIYGYLTNLYLVNKLIKNILAVGFSFNRPDKSICDRKKAPFPWGFFHTAIIFSLLLVHPVEPLLITGSQPSPLK